jgi:hypothetical protein
MTLALATCSTLAVSVVSRCLPPSVAALMLLASNGRGDA